MASPTSDKTKASPTICICERHFFSPSICCTEIDFARCGACDVKKFMKFTIPIMAIIAASSSNILTTIWLVDSKKVPLVKCRSASGTICTNVFIPLLSSNASRYGITFSCSSILASTLVRGVAFVNCINM